MGLTVCPSAIVAAPVELVWENLVQWERYSEWFSADLQVERSEPERKNYFSASPCLSYMVHRIFSSGSH